MTFKWTKHEWVAAGQCTPSQEVEWKREFLGKWVDPAPGPFTHLAPGITSARCAACSTVLYAGPLDDDMAARLEREHGKVCERRALEVGDWVRFCPPAGHWLEGEIVSFPNDSSARVTVERKSDDWSPIGVDARNSAPLMKCHLRRIPRPEQAKATCKRCGLEHTTTECPAVTNIRTPVGDITMRADPTLKPGEFRWEKREYTPVRITKEMIAKVEANKELMAKLQEAQGAAMKRLASKPEPPPAPAPMLYDGLDESRCYAQWCDNRACVEMGAKPMYAMTSAQIDAGRRVYQQDLRLGHSAQLRAKVAAAKERERCAVGCDADDEFLVGCADA